MAGRINRAVAALKRMYRPRQSLQARQRTAAAALTRQAAARQAAQRRTPTSRALADLQKGQQARGRVPGGRRMRVQPASRRGAGLHIPVVGSLWSALGFKWLFETLINWAFRGQAARQARRQRIGFTGRRQRPPVREGTLTADDMIDIAHGRGRYARQQRPGQLTPEQARRLAKQKQPARKAA